MPDHVRLLAEAQVDELVALNQKHELLLVHFGSLRNAIVTIASILELDRAPALVVLALLHAAKEL